MTQDEDVARRAAHDVARLLDRRGLNELVELARRVRQENRRLPATPPQVAEAEDAGCTLRQRDRSA